MNNNPFFNAGLAVGYIYLIANVVFSLQRFSDKPDNIMAPVFMLSLFVLSAAIMGFLFLSKPLELYLEGKKRESINLFLKTTAVFAAFTLMAFVLLVTITEI